MAQEEDESEHFAKEKEREETNWQKIIIIKYQMEKKL